MNRAPILLACMLLAAWQAKAQTGQSDGPPPQHQSDEPSSRGDSRDRDHGDRRGHDHSGGGVGVGVSIDLGKLFGGSRKPADTNVYVGKPDYVTHDPSHALGGLGRGDGHQPVVVSRGGHDYQRQYYYIVTAGGPQWFWYDERLADDDPRLGPLTDVPVCEQVSDDCGNGGPPPPVLADQRPTAVKDDPKDGIPVTGGTVHRGTGEYVNPNNPKDKRAAFYLWFDPDKNSACKECGWYQFLKIVVSVDGTDATATAAKGGSVPSSIGGSTTPGKWGGDWHKKDEDKSKKKKPHVKMPGKPPVEGGAYAPAPIPGVDGAQGLIDAPNWGNTGGLSQILGRLFHSKATGAQPPPDETHTIVITSSFRDYLYCIDPTPPACLGYSEETYVETIKIKLTWVGSGDIEAGGPDNATWKAVPSLESDTSSVSFDGKWQKCS